MKNLLFFTVLFCCLANFVSAQEAKYELKSGILHKEAAIMGQTIHMEIYFDEYGKKETVFTTIELPAELGGSKELMVISEGETAITVDLNEKQAIRTGLPEENINFLNLTPAIIAQYNLKDTGSEETVTGKVCKIYTMKRNEMGVEVDLKVWVWKGIALKTEASGGGIPMVYIETITKIQENVPVPADKFTVPAGITIL